MDQQRLGRLQGQIGVMVVVLAGICAALVVLQPLETVIRHVKDDSFYYFQTARNIVAGYGSTFDRINPTNGYHPLWMLNVLPIYAALPNNPVLALRLVLLLVALYHTSAALILYVLLSRIHNSWIGAIASLGWALSPVVLRINLNGMESGVYALVLSAFVALVTQRLKTASGEWRNAVSVRDCLLIGVFAMLCVLARLDAVLLLAGFGVIGMGMAVLQRMPRLVLILGIVAAPSVVALIAYIVFNQIQFGLLLPISGLIKGPTLPPSLEGVLSQFLWPLGPLIRRLGLWAVVGVLALACITGVVLVARVRAIQMLVSTLR